MSIIKPFLNALKYIVFFALALTLLFLAFRNQDPSELFNELLKVDFVWVVVSMIFGALAIVSRGVRWLILIDSLGYTSSKANSIYSVAIGYFSNIAIPRAGEITRCTSLNQTEKIPVDKLFGTIILERIIDFFILIILIGITFILKFHYIRDFFFTTFNNIDQKELNNIFLVLFMIIVLSLLLFFVFKTRIRSLYLYDKVKQFFIGISDGIKSLSYVKNKVHFFGHTVFIWLMYFAMTYICFFCIPATSNLSLSDGLFIMVIGGIGMVIPTPGGFGSYHFAVKNGLMLLGINEGIFYSNTDPGLLFATTVHSAQTLMTLIFGSVSLFLLFIRKNRNT
ncbi:MAG: lysylphosphatidylglycerol synthase transmembrane domain-containing protein [Bacteroidota bacterium]|nr:lysylphosphatidylglycerol synthase transmembrane domain-containing protein [Bacteroidota bacterium]